MGYDVHITRAEDWAEPGGEQISLDEWLAYVAADPELRLDGAAGLEVPGEGTLHVEAAGLAVWTAYSGDGDGGNQAAASRSAERTVTSAVTTGAAARGRRSAVTAAADHLNFGRGSRGPAPLGVCVCSKQPSWNSRKLHA